MKNEDLLGIALVLFVGCHSPLKIWPTPSPPDADTPQGDVATSLRPDGSELLRFDLAKPSIEGPVSTLTIPTDGLVAYYPFNMNGQDASGHGNDAVVRGPVPVADRFGHANAAYHFDGVDDEVVCINPVNLPSGSAPRTIAGWFRSDKSYQYAADLFGYGAGTDGANFQLSIGSQSLTGDPVVFRVNGWGDSQDWRTYVDPAPYLNGRWHHAAVTYDGIMVAAYFDGVSNGSSSWDYNTDPASITIGAETSAAGWLFTGDIDDVMIFSRVLTRAEIATLAAN